MRRLRVFLASIGSRIPFQPWVSPPLGLLYLAGYLRTKFDLDIKVVNQRESNVSNEALVAQAVAFDADVVGFGSLTSYAHALGPLTRKVREELPEALILLGGPHVSALRAQALADTVADAVVVGEGELTAEQVIGARFGGGDFDQIPGLIWRSPEGAILTNPGETQVIEDLDSLPFPAYDLIDITKYWRLQPMTMLPRIPYITMFSSRGCPYHCSWCHKIFGKKFRAHSAERMVDEIEYYVRTFGVKNIEFVDDIFNFDRERVLAFSRLICQRNIKVKISFPNAIRTDQLTEETVDALADAGTYFSSFALESGSPRLQQLTGKHLNIARFLKGVELATARGIFAYGFAMLGFPTETEEELRQTIDVMCGSKLHGAAFFTVTPFPNTELYDAALKSQPEKLANISYNDMDYGHIRVNLADVPDAVLFAYQRKAIRRFYLSPRRIVRILRDYPEPYRLPYYVPVFLNRVTRGLFHSA